MERIQDVYIRGIAPFAIKNREKSRTVRNILAAVLIFLIFGIAFTNMIDKKLLPSDSDGVASILYSLKHLDEGTVSIISSILLVIVLLLIAARPLKKAKWNWYFLITWYLFCLLIIMAGLSHDIGTGVLATYISLMIILPAYTIVLSDNNDTKAFYDMLSIVIMLFVLIVLLIEMIIFPYENADVNIQTVIGGRYFGITINPNRLGEFAVMGIICSCYIAYRQNNVLRWIAVVNAGLVIGVCILTISRTALISSVLVLAAWLIICFREKTGIKNIMIMVLVIAICAVAMYEITTKGTDPLHIRSQVQAPMLVKADDGANSKKDSSAVTERFFKEGDLDKVSSGRLGLWKMGMEKMTLAGNDVSYAYPMRVLNSEGTGYSYMNRMHNLILEYAFRCGWPVGVILLGIEIWALVFCLVMLFGRKKRLSDARVFSVLTILAFIVESNLEPLCDVFIRTLLLLFYLAIIPLFSFASGFDIRSWSRKLKSS